jgi:ParB family chromosome partitioning protein
MRKRTRDRTEAAIAALANIDGEEAPPSLGRGALVRYMFDLPEQARKERDELVAAANRLDGALPVRTLDASCVHASSWANRHSSAFSSQEYLALKEEIQSSGGNVQPIKVRPISQASRIAVLPGATEAAVHAQQYEIVYGHRRHRACLELGLPVLTLIEDLTDAQLFAQMDRENRQREDLSPWEQGVMYARALEKGLFPSMRQLAESVGCNPATISRTVALARLPADILSLFASPTDLQTRWAAPLRELVREGADVGIERARARLMANPQMSPSEIFAALTETVPGAIGQRFNANPKTSILCLGGRRVGEVLQDGKLGTTVRFYEKLPLPIFSAVKQGIQRALDKF